MPRLLLNDGNYIDQLGLGVYKVGQDIAVDLIRTALDVGYRRIDTASLYDNEIEIGAGIRGSGIDRSEIFVTTKIWNDRQGFDQAQEAIEESLQKLNIHYIDLILIHWPCPKQNLYLETWRAFEKYLETGLVRSIGVSNFNPAHIENLVSQSSVLPVLNQVELHPWFQQADVRVTNDKHQIRTEAWSPLARGKFMQSAVLDSIAQTHSRSKAQVVLRWHIQLGNLVIPKTSNPDRLVENIDVFDFELSDSEMAAIAGLDSAQRTGFNPDDFG